MLGSFTQKLTDIIFIFFFVILFLDSEVDFTSNFIIIRIKNEIALCQRPGHSTESLNGLSIVLLVFVGLDEVFLVLGKNF